MCVCMCVNVYSIIILRSLLYKHYGKEKNPGSCKQCFFMQVLAARATFHQASAGS